jgi:hypothetical protein
VLYLRSYSAAVRQKVRNHGMVIKVQRVDRMAVTFPMVLMEGIISVPEALIKPR